MVSQPQQMAEHCQRAIHRGGGQRLSVSPILLIVASRFALYVLIQAVIWVR
jgi:hypothetical protein